MRFINVLLTYLLLTFNSLDYYTGGGGYPIFFVRFAQISLITFKTIWVNPNPSRGGGLSH